MERIKQRRLQQMKKAQEQRARWKADGHGEYREIMGEKEFFKEMKGVERMVAHFYRENWPCKVMDKHLDLLAKKHLETKFVKVHAEKFPYLTEKLQIWMLPTLALIRKEKVIDYSKKYEHPRLTLMIEAEEERRAAKRAPAQQ